VGISDVDEKYGSPEAAVAFQSIMTRAFTKYTLYHEEIRKVFDPYEAKVIKEMPEIEAKFEELKKAGKQDEAAALLTQFVKDNCSEALGLVQTVHDSMTQKMYDKNKWSR
jgi:dipeptidase